MIIEERKTNRPSFQFYPTDWQTDHNLQSCSLTARGLWTELMCFMHFAVPYGFLNDSSGAPLSYDFLSRKIGISIQKFRQLVAELSEKTVPGFDENGVMFSRRMVRDEQKRLQMSEFGKMGGNPRLKPEPTPPLTLSLTGATRPRTRSSSSSSPSSKTTTGADLLQIPFDLVESEPEIKDWLEYKRQRGQTYKAKGLEALWRTFRAIPRERRRESVDQSMANSWSGLFEKKPNGNGHRDDDRPNNVPAVPSVAETRKAIAEGRI